MTEFKLSEKINGVAFLNGTRWVSGIKTSDVKEFIKRLEEEIEMVCRKRYEKTDGIICDEGDICDECKEKIKLIDTLAGEELSKLLASENYHG